MPCVSLVGVRLLHVVIEGVVSSKNMAAPKGREATILLDYVPNLAGFLSSTIFKALGVAKVVTITIITIAENNASSTTPRLFPMAAKTKPTSASQKE